VSCENWNEDVSCGNGSEDVSWESWSEDVSSENWSEDVSWALAWVCDLLSHGRCSSADFRKSNDAWSLDAYTCSMFSRGLL
jgi:hypothetical protein